MREMKKINGDACRDRLVKEVKPSLEYKEGVNYGEWRAEIKDKLFELLGMDEIAKNACEPSLTVEWSEKREGYTITRFIFESEREEWVPCYLLVPDTGKEKYPVAICLQGHTWGFHESIGEIRYESDEQFMPRAQFALQAVENGFAALAIEQRAMGERRSPKSYGEDNIPYGRAHMCAVAFLTTVALGRTVIGERIWDISRAIDLLPNFEALDTEKIIVTGNSGGGTASFYAGCYDERISLSVPSCSFCSYKTSILAIEHCACNYIPNAIKWFDMQDLACLIAPRRLAVVTGQKDNIFPIDGVRESYKTVEKIYAAAGASDKCRLVETPKHHYWCEDIVWPVINEECCALGWR